MNTMISRNTYTSIISELVSAGVKAEEAILLAEKICSLVEADSNIRVQPTQVAVPNKVLDEVIKSRVVTGGYLDQNGEFVPTTRNV